MAKTAVLISTDRYLWQTLRLALPQYEISLSDAPDAEGDLRFFDLRRRGAYRAGDVLLVPRGERAEAGYDTLSLPVSLSEIARLFSEEERRDGVLVPIPEEKSVRFRGRTVRLTEVEYALFDALYRVRGFCDRQALAREVWGDAGNLTLLNVYLHYLRAKLETEGEKVFVSSRKNGIRIDEKYTEESVC